MFDKGLSVLTSIVVVAGLTTVLLKDRQTTGVVREGTTGFAKILNASIGRG